MATIKRFVHPQSSPSWNPLSEVAPDVKLRIQMPTGENGKAPPELMALTFVDPDQEMHIYVFDDGGRKALIQLLLGTGLVLPK